MVVMILENVTAAMRGELTRWLLEPHSGVFVGQVNALVRERLWEKCCKRIGTNSGVIQIWTTNTEQHFAMRLHGSTQRSIVELEGLQLVRVNSLSEEIAQKLEINSRKAEILEKQSPRGGG